MLEALTRLNVSPEELMAPAPVAAEKRPLFRPLPPAPAFPLDALGALRPVAEALHLTVRAPIAMCAQTALAAATLATQAHYDVNLPSGRRPLTAIFATVAETGERKSSLDRLALRAVHATERRWSEQHIVAAADYRADHAAYEAAMAAAKKSGKGDRTAIRRAIENLGPEPKPPGSPMLLVSDMTPEGIVMHLGEGRPWCGIFAAEGGTLIGGHGFSDDARMRTGALLNALWDGDPIRRRRVLTGAMFLPGRRCTAHVMMQPVVAQHLFGDPLFDGLGLTARILLVAPESAAGTRTWCEPDPSVAKVLVAHDERLSMLLDRVPRLTPDGGLDPALLDLHADARGLWIKFHDACEAAQRSNGDLASIRGFAAKMPEHAGRLAAALTTYAAPEAVEVSPEAMAGGIALAEHYADEALRVFDGAQVAPDLALAQRLASWWQAQPDARQHLAAIYQAGPGPLRDAATARHVVEILEAHGWVRRLPVGIELDGRPRREAWELVP